MVTETLSQSGLGTPFPLRTKGSRSAQSTVGFLHSPLPPNLPLPTDLWWVVAPDGKTTRGSSPPNSRAWSMCLGPMEGPECDHDPKML